MPEEIYKSNEANSLRPLFLTVLCAIVFIGSIVGIIFNTRSYINAETEVQNISSGKSKTQLRHIFSGSDVSSAEPIRISNLNIANYKKFTIGCIVSYILCLVGTVLMYRLKRTGFYSFTLGTFFNLITHFLLFGDNFGSMGISILAALSGFIFVILFSFNLKWMEES